MMITAREKEILQHLKSGRSSRDIAGTLGISERTVKFHVGNILRKLQASNRIEAVVVAMEQGLLA